MNLSYRIYYVFLRNLISYKRFVIPTLVVSLGQPLFYLLTFGIGMGAYVGMFGGRPYLYFLVPGILISSVMLSATFECLYGVFVKMMHERLYDSLIATPLSAEDAIAGDIVWGAFRGLISGGLMLLVAIVMGIFPVSIINIFVLFLLMIFVGILFSSMSMIVTAFAPNFDFFSYYTELVITPMLFFSGVFFPLDKFPVWIGTIAQFMPLTHAVNISRAVFLGTYSTELIYNFCVLLIVEIIAFYLGIKFMKRRLIK